MSCLVIDNCQLEIDTDRGVIYVHSPLGHSALRICGLATPIPDPSGYGRGLDITLKFQPLAEHTFSWKKR